MTDNTQTLQNLIERMTAAGCPDAETWAASEIDEDIPQFARYLVLKQLTDIANNVPTAVDIAVAEDWGEGFTEKHAALSAQIGAEALADYLRLYGRGIISQIIDLLDEGNPDYDRDGVNWILVESDEYGEQRGRNIQGLHESLPEFWENP